MTTTLAAASQYFHTTISTQHERQHHHESTIRLPNHYEALVQHPHQRVLPFGRRFGDSPQHAWHHTRRGKVHPSSTKAMCTTNSVQKYTRSLQWVYGEYQGYRMWTLWRGPRGIPVNMCGDCRFTSIGGKRDFRHVELDYPQLPPSVSDIRTPNAKVTLVVLLMLGKVFRPRGRL
jgi:hypothetical protein